jgi:isocitrate dehydrogenase
MDTQYLDKEQLLTDLPSFAVNVEELGRTDTYHEDKIVAKIKSMSKDNQHKLIKAAIQIAIVGSGNKTYGFIMHKGNVVQLIDIFKECKVLYSNVINTKLDEDTLTARRLQRVFRFHIQAFIDKTNRPSYLWNKYVADKIEYKKFRNICFPGAEHLIKTKEEANFLLMVYKELDKRMNTNFCARLIRVYIARNIPYDEI